MTRLRGRRSDSTLPALLVILIALGTGALVEYYGITHFLPNSVKDGSFLRNQSELLGQPVIVTSQLNKSQKVGHEYA